MHWGLLFGRRERSVECGGTFGSPTLNTRNRFSGATLKAELVVVPARRRRANLSISLQRTTPSQGI